VSHALAKRADELSLGDLLAWSQNARETVDPANRRSRDVSGTAAPDTIRTA